MFVFTIDKNVASSGKTIFCNEFSTIITSFHNNFVKSSKEFKNYFGLITLKHDDFSELASYPTVCFLKVAYALLRNYLEHVHI